MAIYDINGNVIVTESSGSAITGKVELSNLSSELVNEVMVIDENTEIINLLDVSKVEVGKYQTQTSINSYLTGFRTSDYIPVKAGWTYVSQAWDSSGNDGSDHVILFDEEKKWVEKIATGGNGTIRYAIFTPEINGYIRYSYNYSETANPMVFVGLATTDTFVEYTGETLEGEYYYEVAKEFKNMIQRDVEPSNLYGKTVYVIGDSNADNWSSGIAKSELAKRYGCNIKSYASYGAGWASSVGVEDTSRSNAIGQWNEFINDVGISETEYIVPNDVVLVFMMGTNGGSGTFPTDISTASEDVTTTEGAVNYILKRARYYLRNTSIGVVLPWCGSNNDELKRVCEYYKIPTFDLPSIICDDGPTRGLERPDGTTVSQNYFTDGGNHYAVWGAKAITRIMHPWIAYQI